jgi:adenylate kinase family enzyme
MLRKIIYSGDGRKKFILTSFPDIIDQAREFERSCAAISAIIYTTSESNAETPIVEIKNNNLTLFNIDALFQKEHRLKTMSKWDDQKWQEIIGAGSKIQWSAVVGFPNQGKTVLANILSKHLGFKLIDWKAIEEEVKKSLGTEDAPFEGVPPTAKMEDAVVKLIQADKAKGIKVSYIFDSFPYHNYDEGEINAFTSTKLGSPYPDYLFNLQKGGVEEDVSLVRWKKAKEIEGDLSEEQLAAFKKHYTLS